jgi:hypothetical protein
MSEGRRKMAEKRWNEMSVAEKCDVLREDMGRAFNMLGALSDQIKRITLTVDDNAIVLNRVSADAEEIKEKIAALQGRKKQP